MADVDLIDDIEQLRATCKEQQGTIDELSAKLDTMTVCKRCGRDVTLDLLGLSEDTKKAYFKSLLTQKPFGKEYVMFDGMLKVAFEMPHKEILSAQRSAIKSIKDTFDSQIITDIMLLSCLSAVVVVDTDTDEELVIYEADKDARVEKLTDPEQAINELMSNTDYAVLTATREALTMFGKLLQAITDVGLDRNFYEGAGLR